MGKSVNMWSAFAALAVGAACAQAQQATPKMKIDRWGQTMVVEPYAPNIVRVTLSMKHEAALKGPGFGILATPAGTAQEWTKSESKQADVFASARLKVEIERPGPPSGRPVNAPMNDTAKYFSGSTPGAHITFSTPEGRTLVDMTGWSQGILNQKDGTAEPLHDLRPTDPQLYSVGASFASPDDEHYYGLGQNQEGYLDHRGRVVHCWHDYLAPAGQSVCVPFLVTNKGYGILWDNPSKTTIAMGFNQKTTWNSQLGDRVSFFVIAGKDYDEIYSGYKLLTGSTPMLPKADYGYIQCKQRYGSQKDVLEVAKGYRDRKLPADVIVVDWFYYTDMGQFDFEPKAWPDPKAMNDQLHAMGFESMISVWPRFRSTSRYYKDLLDKGWLIHYADGTPVDGGAYDKAGSDIDTTNPDAAKWYWNLIKENILSKGFDSLWADETEPDLPPNGAFFHVGPGTQYFNVYPLFHTGALYDGYRKDFPEKRPAILSRDAYLGAQHNGTIFWSSDIDTNWATLRQQIPTGLNFAATGLTYWSNDTGGWQWLPDSHTPAHKPLIDPEGARDVAWHYDDYAELYTRWFQYAAFLPVFRTHGSRYANEVWSYGPQAEPILEKYLKLRYELMPYIYSLGYKTYQTGAPFLRALPLDFGNDPKVADLRDEYMFGPAFLVAPVTEQGATSREVYLPAGADWYNYWTGKRFKGGQTITVEAPIETLPLFVRAGSIVPLGSAVLSTHEQQTIQKVRIYPGADVDFTLFNDDGTTNAYEKGAGQVTQLHWNEAAHKLTHSGAAVWSGPEAQVVEIVGAK